MTTFAGFPRRGRRAGVRNHLLLLPTSEATNRAVELAAAAVPEAVAVTHFNAGPGRAGSFHLDVLAGFASNPNVGHVVLVGLGDDGDLGPALAERTAARGVPTEYTTLLEHRGQAPLVEHVVARASRLVTELAAAPRHPVALGELVVGTECGGSDGYSGLTANPALGHAVDLLVAEGGTGLLCELTEVIGAEHLLARRAVSPEVGDRLTAAVRRWEDLVIGFGEDLRGSQPSPGNQDGGLTTVEEKSLGGMAKGGTSPVVDVVGYGVEPQTNGLVVMDTPGHDIEQLTGMVAGGVQVVVFTTGRGTPTGSPLAPTIKVSTNRRTGERLSDHIDIDAGPIAEGTATKADIGRRIFDAIVATASGALTRAEQGGQRDFALPRLAPSYGS